MARTEDVALVVGPVLVAVGVLGLAAIVILALLWRRARRQAMRAEERLQALLAWRQATEALAAQARVVVWQADSALRYTLVSVAAQEVYRYAPVDLVGQRTVLDLREPSHRAEFEDRLRKALQRRAGLSDCENRIVTASGEWLWVSTTVVPQWDAQGDGVGLIGCDIDIDARKRLQQALQEAEQRYRLLVEHAQSIIYTIDPGGRLTYVSPSWTKLLGHMPSEVIGLDFRPFVHPEDVPLCEALLEATVRSRQVQPPLTYRVFHRDGRVRYHRSVLVPSCDAAGRLQAVVGNAIDVSTDIELRAELERMATHDPLTGAANRRLFMEQFERELERARRSGRPLALLMMDIDHFKRTNDTYGHAAGDRVLQEFVRRCQAVLRPPDVLGRLGGEEFAVMLPDTSAAQAKAIAERLRRETDSLPFGVPGHGGLTVTVSIGALVAQPGEDADTLLARADAALYSAKGHGRNRVVMAGVEPDAPEPPEDVAQAPIDFPPLPRP